MRWIRLAVIAVLLIAGSGLFSSPALAGDCCNGVWGQAFGLMNSYGSSGTMYGLGRVPVPPYYALHPPVYYGYRLARPYGYSPYAAPAGVLPAEFVQAPKLIDNPFYVRGSKDTESAAPAAETSQVTSVPGMIINPFFRPGAGEVVAK